MRTLHPPITPHTSLLLDVGDGHQVHVERCGTPGALPVIFLHGGPGGGCKSDHRQFFDPARWDAVLFDQRGAGRSLPLGEVNANGTPELVADMERIREHFGLPGWVLFGGSWGAALALAYAEACPDRVLGLVLRGSFLARRRDVEWFFGAGANRLLPREWDAFTRAVELPGDAAVDAVAHLHRRVFATDQALANATAQAWSRWSMAVVGFSLEGALPEGGEDALALAKTRIEMHYAWNRYFLAENQLLAHAARLPTVPTVLVHGMRDLTCTADSAWALHQAVPGSRLEILRTAGHLSSESPMIDALVRAADELATTLAGA